MTPVEVAAVIFTDFQEAYAQRGPGTWSIRYEQGREHKGLSWDDQVLAFGVLKQKDLIKHMAMGHNYRLTERGGEACLHPDLLSQYLGPIGARVAAPPQHVTINAQNMQNTQVGHGNTINATYSTVLTQLAEAIEQSDDVTPEQKAKWGPLLKEIAAHPLTAATVGAMASIVGGE